MPPRSPNNNTENLIKLPEDSGENHIFIGDFNFPSINWNDKTSDRACQNFLECTVANDFTQMIDFPTHVRGNILDLVLTNRPDNIVNIEALGNLSTSDHSILSVDINFRSKFNKTTEMIIDWKNGDNEGLRDFLSTVDWKRELEDMDTGNSWQLIKDKINTGINNFIPKVPRCKPNNHQWMTKNVKRLVRTKQRHYNLYMHTRSQFKQFKQSEKSVKKLSGQRKNILREK